MAHTERCCVLLIRTGMDFTVPSGQPSVSYVVRVCEKTAMCPNYVVCSANVSSRNRHACNVWVKPFNNDSFFFFFQISNPNPNGRTGIGTFPTTGRAAWTIDSDSAGLKIQYANGVNGRSAFLDLRCDNVRSYNTKSLFKDLNSSFSFVFIKIERPKLDQPSISDTVYTFVLHTSVVCRSKPSGGGGFDYGWLFVIA